MKHIISLIVGVLIFIPSYIWSFAYFILHPVGFLEKFLILGAGVWLLGGLQVLFLFFGILLIIKIYED